MEYLPPLLKGAKVTLEITLLSTILFILISFVVGLSRLSKYAIVRIVSNVYVEFFRGTSLLIQLFWIYFALPILLDIRIPTLLVAILALGLNYGAYGSEVVRSSILAVPKGQTEAGIALNMTAWQRMRLILIPQSVPMMLPAFGNLEIELLKGTSLVYLITLSDLTYRGMVLRSFDIANTPLIFVLLLLIYFIIAYVITLGIRLLERRTSVGRL